jgi:hypothetical protein
VTKNAAQHKHKKYEASSKDGFEFRAPRTPARWARVFDGWRAAEFVSGVARTIHKGNELIVRTAYLRSMDAVDPAERLPRQERILRAAAMQEVVEQIHRDRSKRSSAFNSKAAKQRCNRRNTRRSLRSRQRSSNHGRRKMATTGSSSPNAPRRGRV